MYRAFVAMLLIALPASAQVSVGTGGSFTLIRDGGHLSDAGDLFAEMEYQLPIASEHWLGVLIASDGADFSGAGLRWYYGSGDAVAFPGLGLGMYVLNARHSFVGETTAVLGVEGVLEVHIPIGEGELPLTVFGGGYPSIGGDHVQMIRFGVKFSPDLLQPVEDGDSSRGVPAVETEGFVGDTREFSSQDGGGGASR